MHKILVIVLDGVGYLNPNTNISSCLLNKSESLPTSAFLNGNAVNAAYTPNLAKLYSLPLFRTIKAHGTAVGLPSDEDMGNSEVGHNAIGAGRIFPQGATLVNQAIESKAIFKTKTWNKIANRNELHSGQNTLHICGLLSDGNVHSHINHLFALIREAKSTGVMKVRLHLLLDGRDVAPYSSLDYVQKLDTFLEEINSNSNAFSCLTASAGGRTKVTMDRYQNDWKIVEKGYNAMLGDGRQFSSLKKGIETLRSENYVDDQNLPPFVIANTNMPVGPLENNDSFIFFNFRGDRALQITQALTEKEFDKFERKRFPNIIFAGMTQYDGDTKTPELFLVEPPKINNCLTELLCSLKIKQFACSESQKFGHVTYFWNGNRTGMMCPELEEYHEITSTSQTFEETPWMKSAEIADVTIEAMKENKFQIGRINFANGDMVGHTGDFQASILALGCVDLALGRIMQAALYTQTTLIVTADHGNSDEMFELDKTTKTALFDKSDNPKKKTSHTLAPVPFAIYNPQAAKQSFKLKDDIKNAGLANIAATILNLYGVESPEYFEPSLIEIAK